ncbi:MAG: pentapeptide repeat-containing protein [Gammaproteobacteria bacterium]|nr:pentapeptide repeat-containing protein [Gammaproteobacteria bacterium]
MSQLCSYRNPKGIACGNEAEHNGLCCWHDDSVEKRGEQWRQRLQEYARSGASMSGFKLRHANLAEIDLVNHHHKQGLDMSYADLYRADLQHSHLFKLNLYGASLMKANLSHANLHYADLENVNLLGINLFGAKIEHVNWGDCLLQEQQARQALDNGNIKLATDLFEECEEIYRHVRKLAEQHGLFDQAGLFFYHEMVARRMQMTKWSVRRFLSKTVDLICGYGEKPLNVVLSSMVMIFGCALLYWMLGVTEGGKPIAMANAANIDMALYDFAQCVYYSIVTFTTLGYGDITPIGYSRLVAAIEAFVGTFSTAIFVVVFVKKMTR